MIQSKFSGTEKKSSFDKTRTSSIWLQFVSGKVF